MTILLALAITMLVTLAMLVFAARYAEKHDEFGEDDIGQGGVGSSHDASYVEKGQRNHG